MLLFFLFSFSGHILFCAQPGNRPGTGNLPSGRSSPVCPFRRARGCFPSNRSDKRKSPVLKLLSPGRGSLLGSRSGSYVRCLPFMCAADFSGISQRAPKTVKRAAAPSLPGPLKLIPRTNGRRANPSGRLCIPVSYTHLDVYKRQHHKYPHSESNRRVYG